MTTATQEYQAMLAEPIDRVPEGDIWQMEPKFDGHRCMAYVTTDGVTLVNPRGVGGEIWQVPYINESLARRCQPGTVVDGEIVSGGDDWSTVQSILTTHREDRTKALTFMAFDVLAVGGEEVTKLRLRDRRKVLEALFKGRKPDEHFKMVPRRKASAEYLQELLAAGFEGAVVKRLDSRYREGVKGGGWFKVKPQTTAEVELIGFYDATPGSKYEGNAVGGFRFRTEWGYEGKAAGMKDDLRRQMYESPDDFIGLIVEVAHHGVSKAGALKSPQFKRFRTDKKSLTKKKEAKVVAREATVKKERTARTTEPVRKRRNYKAMSDSKLMKVIGELERQGEAYHRCLNNGSGDVAGDLAFARSIAAERGLS